MNDQDRLDQIQWAENQRAMAELTNVYDIESGQPFDWLELWVIYGVSRVV